MIRKVMLIAVLTGLMLGCQSGIKQNQVAALRPVRPAIAEKITVFYNSQAEKALFKNAEAISAQILLVREPEEPQLIELPLAKADTYWQADFTVSDKTVLLLLYRFAAGEKIDDNDGASWHALIHANNKPVEGSHYMLARVLRAKEYFGFNLTATAEEVLQELAAERTAYPANAEACAMAWRLELRQKPGDSTKAVIKADLEKVYEANKNDEQAVMALLGWFEQTGQADRARAIKAGWLEKSPKGKIAQNEMMNKVYQSRDAQQRLTLIDSLLSLDVLSEQNKESLQSLQINDYAKLGQIDKAEAQLASIKNPDGMLFNNLAWQLIEKNENLDKAIALAKKGVEVLRDANPALKPAYLPAKEWQQNRERSLAMALDTYAMGLEKSGDLAGAEAAYEEAYLKGKGESAEVNARLVACYLKNGKAHKAVNVAEECLSDSRADESMVELYQKAYVKQNGSAAGFADQLQKLQQTGQQRAKERLQAKRINKAAPDFELEAMDGHMVRLSQQKGKVVVVDFWATWCGPCLRSFPALQKVYEYYKANPSVLILALNTWERDSGPQREERVRKFIKDNTYTFPVLFDVGTVDQYGVTGIPTKFIIDKKGQIAFQTIGFESSEEMITEMTLEIDLLLAE